MSNAVSFSPVCFFDYTCILLGVVRWWDVPCIVTAEHWLSIEWALISLLSIVMACHGWALIDWALWVPVSVSGHQNQSMLNCDMPSLSINAWPSMLCQWQAVIVKQCSAVKCRHSCWCSACLTINWSVLNTLLVSIDWSWLPVIGRTVMVEHVTAQHWLLDSLYIWHVTGKDWLQKTAIESWYTVAASSWEKWHVENLWLALFACTHARYSSGTGLEPSLCSGIITTTPCVCPCVNWTINSFEQS